MKNTQKTILGLLVLLLFACTPDEDQKAVTTVTGQILNPKGEIISFSYGEEVTVKDTLDSAGSFTATFDIEKATEIVFNHGGEYGRIYLRPGDNLAMTLDTEAFDETLTFEGDAAEINNYKAALVLLDDTLGNYGDLMLLAEGDFLRTVDSLYTVKVGVMDSFDIQDKTFVEDFKTELKLAYAVNKLSYPNNHRYFAGLDSFEVSEDYYSFKASIDVNDTTLLDIRSFLTYVNSLVRQTTSEKYQALPEEEKSPGKYYALQLDAVKETVSSKPVQRDILYNMVYQSFTYLEDSVRDMMLSYWKDELNPKPDQLTKMDKKAAKWAELAAGNPAPDFRYATIEGDTMTLADFKGKLVYIDVWATWCGPCIREHPSMEKLQERFEGEDVIFIAVSIDNSPEPWKKMVAEKELGGVHLFAPNAWGSTIVEDYMIAGIPRFILIDRDGKIIDPDAARPSGDIGDQLEDLLTEESV